jgi:integrase
LNWAYDKEYHSNQNFKKFKASEDEIEVIYLTIEELMTLFNHDFESPRLNHVRDVYCFGCFTGLRFSDIKQLRVSNVFEDHLLLNIQKTKTIGQNIPLNNYAQKILSRYKDTIYVPLPVISSQKFNKYIKECCEIAKIDTPTSITRYVGQKRIDKLVPKYEVITSHTARKTFVTNSLILGMKEMVVRNITGHKKEETFRKYVKIAEDFKKNEMDNTWNKI